MQTLLHLFSPAGTLLLELGAPAGTAVGAVVLAAGITTAAAHAWFRRG